MKKSRVARGESRGKPLATPDLKKAFPSHPKERGEWVELLFMATAARMGLKVAKPHGDSARFDVIVEANGQFHRVQVKSTTSKRDRRYQVLCYWHSTSPTKAARTAKSSAGAWQGHARRYSPNDFDFVAAYVILEDTWFIIPVAEVRVGSFYLPPREHPEISRYGQFMEAWHLLGLQEDKLTIHAAAESDLVMTLIKWKIAQLCGMPRIPHPGKPA